jgi:hypothetical protein
VLAAAFQENVNKATPTFDSAMSLIAFVSAERFD